MSDLRDQRQRELTRLDAWLQKLGREHPVRFWLLAWGIALAFIAFSSLFDRLVNP